MGEFNILFVVAFLGIMGILFLAIYSMNQKKQKSLMKYCSAQTLGKIIEMRKSKLLGSEPAMTYTSWYPVYEYEVNGQKIVLASSSGYARTIFEPGQKVTICYNPENIKEFYVPEENAFNHSWIIAVVGASFLTFAGIVLGIWNIFLK